MPPLTREESVALGVIPPPPGVEELPEEAKITKLPRRKPGQYRRRITLTEDREADIKKLLKIIWEDTQSNTKNLKSKLQRFNDMVEGVREEKTFPWKGACSTHIPLPEIHMAILHTGIVTTVLDSDPVWFVRTMIPKEGGADSVDPKVEWFLNWVCKVQLKLDASLSEIIYNGLRDPLAVGCLDWVEEYRKQYDVERYDNTDTFTEKYPTPELAGASAETYQSIIGEIAEEGSAEVKVERRVVSYRGPRSRVVECKDMVVFPATSPSFEYAQFVGDQIMQRTSYFEVRARLDWFDKAEVDKLKATPARSTAIDTISQSQDRIEGLGRQSGKPDEHVVMQGILRYDFGGKGDESMYGVVYNPDKDLLLRFEDFPYIHNRLNYIPFRIKKRSNRLMGWCVPAMLEDISSEVDTSHQQRIDSRTIAIVPSFKKLETSEFDPTREDQKFYPGVTFKVRSMNEVAQFEIHQTDMGLSMQEEQSLFSIGEARTGASLGRSGQESVRDPRAPAKKTALLLAQSNSRIDEYIKELSWGINEYALQILELYYQFSPETVSFAMQDPETQQWISAEIARTKLRNNNMSIHVARTSVTDNPDNAAQRAMIEYQILSKEPLIGNNMMRRYELVRDLVVALRRKDANKICPPLKQMLQEMTEQNVLNNPLTPESIRTLHSNINKPAKPEPNGTRQGSPDTALANMGGAA